MKTTVMTSSVGIWTTIATDTGISVLHIIEFEPLKWQDVGEDGSTHWMAKMGPSLSVLKLIEAFLIHY